MKVQPSPLGTSLLPQDQAGVPGTVAPALDATPPTAPAHAHTQAGTPGHLVIPIPKPNAFDPHLIHSLQRTLVYLLSCNVSEGNKAIALGNINREIGIISAAEPSEPAIFEALFTKPFGNEPGTAMEHALAQMERKRRNTASAAEVEQRLRAFVVELAHRLSAGRDLTDLMASL